MATVYEHADKAKAAFADDNFHLAVDHYTQAINLSPQTAHLYADRAQSNLKLDNFTEALADCNRAIELDPSMTNTYLSKGIACVKLKKYDTAREALVTGASLAENDAAFMELIKECDEYVACENGVFDGSSKSLEKAAYISNGFRTSSLNMGKAGQGGSIVEKEKTTLDKPQYRHDFYQRTDEVVVAIFAKGIPAENVAVNFGEQIVSVTINMLGGSSYRFQPRLFGKIVPDKCRYEVLKTKVEIRLAKAEAITWKSLEYTEEPAAVSGRPSYPSSSSKRRVEDWDKVEAQVKMEEEKEEKMDGDAGLTLGEIYRNGDEDSKRAMDKSFFESNGTVLSTSWEEVGGKKVEPTPPHGMELKKWEY